MRTMNNLGCAIFIVATYHLSGGDGYWGPRGREEFYRFNREMSWMWCYERP